jgi:hypothetical protein
MKTLRQFILEAPQIDPLYLSALGKATIPKAEKLIKADKRLQHSKTLKIHNAWVEPAIDIKWDSGDSSQPGKGRLYVHMEPLTGKVRVSVTSFDKGTPGTNRVFDSRGMIYGEDKARDLKEIERLMAEVLKFASKKL